MNHDAETPDSSIAQTAAEWVTRRDRGLSAAEVRAFAQWRAADPRHKTEFDRVAAAWGKLDLARAAPELGAMADGFLERARTRLQRRRMIRAASLTFATAAALAVGIFTWQRQSSLTAGSLLPVVTENYRVIASTMQRTELPDGSLAELNGSSRIEVDYSPSARRVRLVEGEAHFVVEKNPDWPFFVTAGPVTVRAVGTAFNVRLENAAIEVLVTEGRVKLEHSSGAAAPESPATTADAAPSLVRGQRAVINLTPAAVPANVAIGEVNPTEMGDALGWQSTRLVFNNTPLEEVIAGFNHFNTRRLALGDARLRSRTLTGVFRADNLDGFVRLLRASVDVKHEERTPTEIVLLPVR